MQLIKPYFPELVGHVWLYFLDLSATRESNSSPITFQEIKAWAELTQTPILPREVELILRLDRTFRKVINDA